MTVFDALSPPVVAACLFIYLFVCLLTYLLYSRTGKVMLLFVLFVCLLFCYLSHLLSYKLHKHSRRQIFGWIIKFLALKPVLALLRIINVEHLPEIAILMSD